MKRPAPPKRPALNRYVAKLRHGGRSVPIFTLEAESITEAGRIVFGDATTMAVIPPEQHGKVMLVKETQ